MTEPPETWEQYEIRMQNNDLDRRCREMGRKEVRERALDLAAILRGQPELFRRILLDLLAPQIAEITLAVSQEVHS